MNSEQENRAGGKRGGIRLNQLNILLICLGLAISALLVVSMYQTSNSVREIAAVTDNYLNNQQAGGMMRDVSGRMAEQAAAFVQGGEPGAAKAYEQQMNALAAQLDLYVPSGEGEAEDAYRQALDAYTRQAETDLRAMRLAADMLPPEAFAALPEFIRQAELSPEDQALDAEGKKAKAVELLASEEYAATAAEIQSAVDRNHRLSSVEGKAQAAETAVRVNGIVTAQRILVALIVLLSVLALVANRILIISPIRKSAENLDRQEPIPERGCYEMRHLARVYNDVLRDNREKTEALSYAATHDALTGLSNRAVFDRVYQARKKGRIGLIIVDVDHFKQYNDEFGHDVGDRVLRLAAEGLKRHFRSEDLICRIGGDEFSVIMPNIGQANAREVRKKIIRINEELKEAGSDLPPITLSAGVAFHDRPDPKGSLFRDADGVLLDHKKTRDTCCAVYGED